MKTIYVANTYGEVEEVGGEFVEGIDNWEEYDLGGVDVPESIVKYYGCDGVGKVVYKEDVGGDILKDIVYVDEQLF